MEALKQANEGSCSACVILSIAYCNKHLHVVLVNHGTLAFCKV